MLFVAILAFDDARQTIADTCKIFGATNPWQCWDKAGVQDARLRAQAEAFEDNRAANARLEKEIKEARSRTRLAESAWGQPYQGLVTAALADHSVIQIPACPPGGRPVFMLGDTSATPGAKLETTTVNGFWLFDVYHDTPSGKVYPRAPVAGTIHTFCTPIAATSQGGKS
jgi:hypothetical protein